VLKISFMGVHACAQRQAREQTEYCGNKTMLPIMLNTRGNLKIIFSSQR